MKVTKAPLSLLLGLFLLFASPSAFAEDPGWHSGRVVSIHTNGLQPLRIRLDPSTREATRRQQFCFAYAESQNDAQHWGAAVSDQYELGDDAEDRRQDAVDNAIASCEAESDWDCSVHRTNAGCTYNP